MALDDFDLAGAARRTPRTISRPPVTGRVIKLEDGGAWVAPIGADTRHPIGPCRGPASVAEGDVVLLVWTDDSPWIAQVDGGA